MTHLSHHPSQLPRPQFVDAHYENGGRPIRSTSGRVLDPTDGRPMFDVDADGLPRSRRRYLAETADERKAARLAELRAFAAAADAWPDPADDEDADEDATDDQGDDEVAPEEEP